MIIMLCVPIQIGATAIYVRFPKLSSALNYCTEW
uniref:Uncharacterized protein n=1 Tax=Arundo donax TaxID=35708 RepID=A0A0A9GHZ0_ARUDO